MESGAIERPRSIEAPAMWVKKSSWKWILHPSFPNQYHADQRKTEPKWALVELQIHNILSKIKWCVKVLSLGRVCCAARDNWNKEYERTTTTAQEFAGESLAESHFSIRARKSLYVMRLRIKQIFKTMNQEFHAHGCKEGSNKVKCHGRGTLFNKIYMERNSRLLEEFTFGMVPWDDKMGDLVSVTDLNSPLRGENIGMWLCQISKLFVRWSCCDAKFYFTNLCINVA